MHDRPFGFKLVWTNTNGSQKFNVIVPPSISLTAPSEVTITHDETDNDQTFAPQSWAVSVENGLNGVTVTFETATPFVHITANLQARCRPAVSVGTTAGPAAWTISKATDTTAYGSNDDSASVSVTSNGVGRANLNLSVKFITNGFGTFAAGTYSTTVVGQLC